MWFIIGIIWTYFGMFVLNVANEKTQGYLNLYQTKSSIFSRYVSHILQIIMIGLWPIVAIVSLMKYHWDTGI